LRQTRVPKYIVGYGKSYALLSNAPNVSTAVIFVHGFGGNPTSTWTNFQGLVDEYSGKFPYWTNSDLFFFAYDSLHTPIRRNAALLGDFVEVAWYSKWMGAGSPDISEKYQDLILVGHSEGGVVIRRLILDRYEAVRVKIKSANPDADASSLRTAMKPALASDFILASHLRLFAPACRGTNFSSLAGFLTSLSHVVSALTASFLVRNELLKDSPVLMSLQAGTESAHEEFGQVRSLYTRPIFGIPDQIVYSESYKEEELLWDEGYDHFGVCKPNYVHIRPLEFVSK
jgi:pimeloyl-ACP methyl ester carboxylesterase